MTHLEYAPAHWLILGHGDVVEALVEYGFVVVDVVNGHEHSCRGGE